MKSGFSHKYARMLVLGIGLLAGIDVPATAHAEDSASEEVTFVRNVLVEEFTGTACGWCPRGMVGMQLMHEVYGNRFVGIALHWYNTNDVMFLQRDTYYPLTFSSAPSCRLNRGEQIDPKYGSGGEVGYSVLDNLVEELERPATVAVTVEGQWNIEQSEVSVTAKVKTLNRRDHLQVEFVLVADSLGGLTSAWRQANNYASHTAEEIGDPDMAPFCADGIYGKPAVAARNLFNDVAIAGSFAEGVSLVEPLLDMQPGEERTVGFTLSMPDKALLRNSINPEYVSVVAIVTDGETGEVENADKRRVGEQAAATAIRLRADDCVPNDQSASIRMFDLQGRRLAGNSAPAVYVIKQGSKVRKVVNTAFR